MHCFENYKRTIFVNKKKRILCPGANHTQTHGKRDIFVGGGDLCCIQETIGVENNIGAPISNAYYILVQN